MGGSDSGLWLSYIVIENYQHLPLSVWLQRNWTVHDQGDEMIRWSDLCFCSCAHRRCLGACAISRPDWATSNVFMLLFFLSLAHLLSLKWQVCPKIHSEAIRACFDKHQDGAKDSYWSWYCLIFFCGYQWQEGGGGMWVWPWYVWKHWGGRRDQHAGSPTRWTNCILYIYIYNCCIYEVNWLRVLL